MGVKVAFLVVSTASLLLQAVSLRTVTRLPALDARERLAARGLRRTGIGRVAAAMAYVVLGTWALAVPGTDLATATVTVFIAVQLMFQANAVLDVRLRRQLANPQLRGRHRRR